MSPQYLEEVYAYGPLSYINILVVCSASLTRNHLMKVFVNGKSRCCNSRVTDFQFILLLAKNI